MTTVGVLAAPLERYADAGRFRRAVAWKANPRSEGYMRARFAESIPDGRLVVWGEPTAADAVRAAERVVLLYPDAIGLGWRPVERAVLGTVPRGATVEVLNGRRRRFALDPPTLRALRLRRVLEATMLLEVAAAPVIVALAPVLWAIDAMRGRR